VRGTTLEPRTDDTTPQFAPSTGPVQLEAGATLVVLVRVVNARPERVMSTTADCPLDAGNRAFYWLTDVSAAESLRYLDSLTRTPSDTGVRPRLADSAITAIGFHRDPAADAVLDRLVAPGQDAANRRQAATALASSRGAHGFQVLSGLVKTETDAALRRSFASALGQTREPGTIDALLTLARDDRDADVRADAVYRYAQRAGIRGLDNLKSVLTKDANENVRRRAVAGIATMASDTSVPLLIDLARQGPDATVRKDAVSALGRSTDARAKAFLEEIVQR
jgi:HEAT repeat protein